MGRIGKRNCDIAHGQVRHREQFTRHDAPNFISQLGKGSSFARQLAIQGSRVDPEPLRRLGE
jgi:hypothetical protein